MSDPSPYSAISYYGHLLAGSIVLVSILVAFLARKGSSTHVRAGKVFTVFIVLTCVSSALMLFMRFVPPLFLATATTIYALCGGWLCLRPRTRAVAVTEYLLSGIELIVLSVFLFIGVSAALAGRVPLFAPLVVAIIPALLLVEDFRWFLGPGHRNAKRVSRHLERMIWASIIAVRAPLVEITAAGVPIPAPVLLFGPVLIGVGAILWSRRRLPNSPL
ncbi:MAG: hypothetical protein AAFQ82_23615 [Myxococcota bacterium]